MGPCFCQQNWPLIFRCKHWYLLTFKRLSLPASRWLSLLCVLLFPPCFWGGGEGKMFSPWFDFQNHVSCPLSILSRLCFFFPVLLFLGLNWSNFTSIFRTMFLTFFHPLSFCYCFNFNIQELADLFVVLVVAALFFVGLCEVDQYIVCFEALFFF